MNVFLIMDQAQRVAQKSAHMSDIDPNGWTLTLVSVCVVFTALLILYLAYSLIGEVMVRRGVISPKAVRMRRKMRAASHGDCSEQAAIALALHCYLIEKQESDIHDNESGIITITRQ